MKAAGAVAMVALGGCGNITSPLSDAASSPMPSVPSSNSSSADVGIDPSASLVIQSRALYPLAPHLQVAWERVYPGKTLQFVLPPPPIPGKGVTQDRAAKYGDVVGVLAYLAAAPEFAGDYVGYAPLRSFLNARNMDLSQFPADALKPFTRSNGELWALPLRTYQLQFYVNKDRLAKLGLVPQLPVTYDDMVKTLQMARLRGHLPKGTPGIGGLGWGRLELWGSVVLGMGGTLRGKNGMDLGGAVEATKSLVELAQTYSWDPAAQGAYVDFSLRGFANLDADALFAFFYPTDLTEISSASPLVTMRPSPFPAFALQRIVPSVNVMALAMSQYSKRQDIAADFLAWLYEPDQQKILVSNGMPPVTLSPALLSLWDQYHESSPAQPLVDLQHYVDIAVQLGITQSVNKDQIAFYAASERMYKGADVRTELVAVQKEFGAK